LVIKISNQLKVPLYGQWFDMETFFYSDSRHLHMIR